ncbi:MAG: hypothetical protein WAO12_10715 [Venatoribacter sp.]
MLDSILLFVLLLVGIASGWTLGVRYARQSQKKDYPDFIPTLEYLIAESNNEALNQFINIPKHSSESVELLLKLGRALREKGEIDRAIPLHQALFARTDLSANLQQGIKLELTADYLHAGLLDRAERLLEELLATKGPHYERAAQYLVELYEEMGDWRKVLNLYQEKKLPKNSLDKRVSHAVIELAEEAERKKNFLETRQLCRLALKIDNRCARAYVVQGNLAYSQDEPHEAIRCYLKALEINSLSIVTILAAMCDSYAKVGDIKGLTATLSQAWESSHYEPILTVFSQCIVRVHGPEKAVSQLLGYLTEKPSNAIFLTFVGLVVEHEFQLDKLQLQALYDILHAIVADEPKFQCSHCGLKTAEFHWRCQSCKNWSTVRPFVFQSSRSKLNLP